MPKDTVDKGARSFEEIALTNVWVTKEQITECKDIQQKAAAIGLKEELEEILIKKGYITKQQASAIHAMQGKGTRAAIEGYEIIAKIGQGGMGAVYKARQTSMDRIVAIKALLPKFAKEKDSRERFLREAKAIAKLSHPNIVSGIDAGVSNNIYYYVMEFVEGTPLDKILEDRHRLSEKETANITLQIARALDHAYKHSMVHRDIKPANIIVMNNGSVKLTDLGLARFVTDTDTFVTQTGIVIGTPHYLSPEQAKGEKNIDTRSDIYSLGITLYEMLTGRTPFVGESAAVVVSQRLNKDVTFPPEIVNEISPNIRAVVRKMTERDRRNRYQTPDKLVEDLEAILRGEAPSLAKPTMRILSSPKPATTPAREPYAMHSKKIPIAIGGGIIAAVILAAIFLIPKDRTTPSNTKDNPNAIASNDNSDNPNNPSNTKDTPNNVNTSQPAVVNNTSSTERQKEAEARYNAAINYANGHTNPEELEGVIKYFTDTLPYLRGTENYENWARERIDKYKGDLQRVMDTRFDEVATATSNEINASNNYRNAINILDKAVNMFDNPDWRRRITTKKDELFREADMKARQIFNTATELESRQKYQDAIKSLNTVQSFGIPELEREAQGRISQISQKIKAEKDVERELIRQKEKLFTAKRVEWFIELRERKYEEVMKEASSLMAELKGTTFEDALKDMILNLKFPKTLFEDVKNVATGEIKVGDPKTRDPKTGKFKVMKDIKEIEFDYVLKNGIKFDRKFINRDTKGEISIGGVGVYLDVGGGRTTVIDAETIIRIYDLIENPRDLDTRLTQEAEINLAKGLFLFFDGEITKSERYLKDARDKGAPVDNYFFNEINKINRKLKGQGANIDQPQDNKDKPKEDKTATGLYAEYFSGIELNGGELRAMQVDDDINLNLRDESPIPGKVPKDNFSIRWTGTITFPATGRYEFTTVSDDGVRLYIENAKVIDNWSQHAAKEDKATVDGNKGEHAIKLEYFEAGGPGIIQLFWNYDDKTKRLLTTGDFKVLIPQQYFTHDTGKLMIKMR